MRIAIFVITFLNLIFVPTKFCVENSSICKDTGYDIIFSITPASTIDFGRLIIQLLILGLLFGATYSKHYSKLVNHIKSILK
tara:strand:+ start:104 stop:349 length:246 start_codon:yes stop_codon:yes gene_type:complete